MNTVRITNYYFNIKEKKKLYILLHYRAEKISQSVGFGNHFTIYCALYTIIDWQ